MRTQQFRFRLLASVAAAAMIFAGSVPPNAFAQSAPGPTPPGAAQPQTQTADPPARVGRLARINGTVSFRTADADHWDPASLNYPITSNNNLWTEPKAEADVEVSGNRIVMSDQTELDVNTLDDHTLNATLPQGAVYLRLRNVASGDNYTVITPRGTISIGTAGRYEVVAGDTQNPTTVTVVEGAAQISGEGINVELQAKQTATIQGANPFQASVGGLQPDPFLTAMLDRERPPAVAQAAAPPPVVQQMTGAEDLAEYGAWQPSGQYGQVWYPHDDTNYVPYRNGHWAYVSPWGWTWVDNAPWGFAPSHYGRWVEVDHRWGWTPGYASGAAYAYGSPDYVAPAYAPAVVGFFGGAAVGAAVGLAAGFALGAFAGGSVGWAPLGWNQPYYPSYRASSGYFGRLNGGYVNHDQFTTVRRTFTDSSTRNSNNNTNSNNRTTNNTYNTYNYASQPGATVVPASAMASGRPVAAVAKAPVATQLASYKSIRPGVQVLQPNRTTPGVTPALAARAKLPDPPKNSAFARVVPASTGPAITHTAAATAATTVRPTLATTPRSPAATSVAKPAAAAAKPVAPEGSAAKPAAAAVVGKPIAPEGSAAKPAAPALATPATRPATTAVEPKPGAPGPAIAPKSETTRTPALATPQATAKEPTAATTAKPPITAKAPTATAAPAIKPAPGPEVKPETAAKTPALHEPAATPQVARPVTPAPQVERPATPAPQVARPATPAPQVERPATPAPQVARPVTPAPQVERPATPAPQVARPATPAPQVERPATPAPQVARPVTPAPQVERPATPAQPRPAPAPAVHAPSPPPPRPEPAAKVPPKKPEQSSVERPPVHMAVAHIAPPPRPLAHYNAPRPPVQHVAAAAPHPAPHAVAAPKKKPVS